MPTELMPTERRCASLEEVRAEIDRLDRAIVPLLASRLDFALQAVRFKSNDDEVRAPARVEMVIANARELAREYGASEAAVEKVYRALIAAMSSSPRLIEPIRRMSRRTEA